jgi:hypothetical protein
MLRPLLHAPKRTLQRRKVVSVVDIYNLSENIVFQSSLIFGWALCRGCRQRIASAAAVFAAAILCFLFSISPAQPDAKLLDPI